MAHDKTDDISRPERALVVVAETARMAVQKLVEARADPHHLLPHLLMVHCVVEIALFGGYSLATRRMLAEMDTMLGPSSAVLIEAILARDDVAVLYRAMRDAGEEETL